MADDPQASPALTGATMAASMAFDIELTPSVVLVFDASLAPRHLGKGPHRRRSHPFRQVARLSTGIDIVVAAGPGSPVAAITVELLVALGVRRIISVGVAGLLLPHGSAADDDHLSAIMVVDHAESDEGTSRHYHADVRPDAVLTAALIEESTTSAGVTAMAVTTLTTDVPFRNTPARLDEHRARASVVEMECSALFAASRHFGIQAGSLLVPSDAFDQDSWRALDAANTRNHLEHAVELAAHVLSSPLI